jgi:hypothetical protein
MRKLLLLSVTTALLSTPTYAQQQISLTLTCTGTSNETLLKQKETLSTPVGVVIAGKTISLWGVVLPIIRITPLQIDFMGDDVSGEATLGVGGYGSVDRVTGVLSASISQHAKDDGKLLSQTDLELRCRPAQRLF